MGHGHHHHHHHHHKMDAQEQRTERGRETRKVAAVSGVVNLLLSLAQILVGLLAHSAALVADGIHSASDLLSDILVWFAARHAAQAPDADHPYGHGRFETAATLGLGILLTLVALGIVLNGFERLFDADRPVPGGLALLVAAVGIAAKESLYWYTILVARRLRSEMLRANAWHHRSDAISSVVVLVGVGGAVMGYSYMDAVAAILVGLMVAKIGWNLAWGAMSELVDTALDEAQVAEAKAVIMAVDGVGSVHLLRTRTHGAEASADVHVQVSPHLSVSEGHMISQAVEDRLIQLSWRGGTALVWDREELTEVGRHHYEGEGWGLCFDGHHLVMSDGTSRLTFRDPETFEVVRQIRVVLRDGAVGRLNELECAEGWIYANVYTTDWIVQIDPQSGLVHELIDAAGLLSPEEARSAEVLNGIAYNPEERVFYLTGKLWPKLFTVRFVGAGQN